jgi:hypothetical protein
MWRDNRKYHAAVTMADALRLPRDVGIKLPSLLRSHILVEIIFKALAETGAPVSKQGILEYLLRIATKRPRTFVALLCKAVDLKQAKRSKNLRILGADLEKILIEALEGWRGPDT